MLLLGPFRDLNCNTEGSFMTASILSAAVTGVKSHVQVKQLKQLRTRRICPSKQFPRMSSKMIMSTRRDTGQQ